MAGTLTEMVSTVLHSDFWKLTETLHYYMLDASFHLYLQLVKPFFYFSIVLKRLYSFDKVNFFVLFADKLCNFVFLNLSVRS